MKIKGWDLKYFNSGEWQVVDEKLKDLEKINRTIGGDGYCPGRKNLFRALQIIPSENVRVAIIAQDPYPSPAFATGVAFSIPESSHPESKTKHSGDANGVRVQGILPPTLQTFLGEYVSDLGYDLPHSGNLERWSVERGVLLWNAIPSCLPGKSLSHDWPEWAELTKEIIQTLSKHGICFAFLGQVARRYVDEVDFRNNAVITTSHPSPRGSLNSRSPFVGSRLFSTINDKLVNNGQEKIDWKLGG